MSFLKYTSLFLLSILIAAVPPAVAENVPFSSDGQKAFWEPYQHLLDTYLSPITREGIKLTGLDYTGLKNDPDFKKMEKRLKDFAPDTIPGDEEQIAFWINAYNFLAIKLVTDNYPVESIKDIGSFFTSVWNKDAGIIGGKEYSLGEIEHEILREKFSEPRIQIGRASCRERVYCEV